MVITETHIRRAIPLDKVLISKLARITFFETFSHTCTAEDMDGFLEEYFNEKQVSSELSDAKDYFFIAFVNNNAAGYIRIKEAESEVEIVSQHSSIELKRIYVLSEFHAKGIGALLMNFAIEFACNKNYEIIWLGVWEHNERAKAFYQKFGFINSGITHPFPIGNTPQTDIWLYKFLRQ